MASAAPAYSLQRRLLLALLAAVALVWLGTAVYSYFEARHEINRLLDAHLAQSASLLVAQAGHELEELDLEHAPGSGERGRRVAFQIWERGRTLLLHSANAPATRLSPREEGFSSVRIDSPKTRSAELAAPFWKVTTPTLTLALVGKPGSENTVASTSFMTFSPYLMAFGNSVWGSSATNSVPSYRASTS